MKLYNSVGPNPQVVRTFMAERGISVPLEEVDIMGGANRQADYLKVNPAGQLPALELDDGSILTEITVICEYLDERHPGDTLMGDTAEERAKIRSWTRWADLNVCEPLANGFRFSEGLPLFQDRMRCVPEAADGLKACAQDKLEWLDGQLGDRAFLAGDRYTLADILLSSFLAFGEQVGQPLNRDLKTLSAWFDRCQARESSKA
ncbi:MAG: glutathione S-transferase family protein [Pseudomonadota bacterium]|nr:glutathione S-transferase family protein [Pseudomonadota bacterium]